MVKASKAKQDRIYDIAIVGDGLAGSVMALAVAQLAKTYQLRCCLIGPSIEPDGRDDGRTTAIMQDGAAFLDRLNIWDEQGLQAVPLQTMRLISETATIRFPASDIGLPQFGFNIANFALKTMLAKQIAATPSLERIASAVTDIAVADATASVATLHCADGRTLQARLVIGADGKNSVVRTGSSIAVKTSDPDQQALVCVVEAEEPHEFTSTEWYHSGGPFTLVPMAEQKLGVVYCDTERNIADLMGLSLEALSTYFTDFSKGLYGDLTVVQEPQIWPIRPQQAVSLIAPRVALIAEAAHIMPPLAAQGFNTSLRDIEALCAVIAQAVELGQDIGQHTILQIYQDARAADATLRGWAVNRLNTVIRRDDAIGRRLHAFGFKTLDRVPALKKLVMRTALAPRVKAVSVS